MSTSDEHARDPAAGLEAGGRAALAWIADYLRTLESRPVRPATKPGDVRTALPAHAPEAGAGDALWSALAADLDTLIAPHLTHWQHPGFFAYFPCNASVPAIVGDLLSAGLNVNGMLWATSPAATELEQRVLDWCAELFGLPEAFRWFDPSGTPTSGGGVIQGTASEATLIALLAARHRARAQGIADDAMTFYTSAEAHSSVVKAAMIAGHARDADDHRRLRLIATGPASAIDPTALAGAVTTDRAAGLHPTYIALTAGTTGLGAFDDVAAVVHELAAAGISETDRPWLHLDAAWAGVAAVCDEHRSVLAGATHADSLCINPHKWLLTNFDCDLFFTRLRAHVEGALSITPEYLRQPSGTDAPDIADLRDWQIPLGRRMRALKLWLVLRYYGAEGVRTHIRNHVTWATQLAERIEADPRFELVVPRSLSLVCLRATAGDDATRRLIDAVNARGRVFVSHTKAPAGIPGTPAGAMVIRIAIGATLTEARHVDMLWDELDTAAG